MNELKVIYLEEIKEQFKTKKAIFILIFSALMLFFAYTSSLIGAGILFFFGAKGAISWPILVTYYLLFAAIPLFAVFIGHDLISSDIENYYMRGLATKVKRTSILLAKFLALSTIISGLSLILIFSASIFASVSMRQSFDFFHPLSLWLYLSLMSFAISSIIILCSAISSRSSQALYLSITFILLILILGLKYDSIGILSPFSYINTIISFELIREVFLALTVFAGYIIICLTVAIAIFRKRDL